MYVGARIKMPCCCREFQAKRHKHVLVTLSMTCLFTLWYMTAPCMQSEEVYTAFRAYICGRYNVGEALVLYRGTFKAVRIAVL